MLILRQGTFSSGDIKYRTEGISFRSPYDKVGDYDNWKGDAKKYYGDGQNVYYRKPEETYDYDSDDLDGYYDEELGDEVE